MYLTEKDSLLSSSNQWKSKFNHKRQWFISLGCLFMGICVGILYTNHKVKDINNTRLSESSIVISTPNTLSGYKKTRGPYWSLNKPDPLNILTEPKRAKSFDELPIHWDWRDYNGTGINLLTSIGNQMQPRGCGSCWAFASTRALSDRIKIGKYLKYGKVYNDILLSPQVLLDCGMTSFGSCKGGDPRYAYQWIHQNGIVDETCNPYIASSPSWFTEGKTCAETQCHTCNIQGVCTYLKSPKKYYISEYSTFNGTTIDEIILEMMSEIYYRGPIVASMYAHSKEFETYKGGYILQDSIQYSGTTHDVSIVGWGEIEKGLKYWIVRNSFGTQWGEEGWFRAERGKNIYNMEEQGLWAVPFIE